MSDWTSPTVHAELLTYGFIGGGGVYHLVNIH